QQLSNLREVIKSASDTTFSTDARIFSIGNEFERGTEAVEFKNIRSFEMLSTNEIISSSMLSGSPQFPTPFPVKGTLSQTFSAEAGHYGIDIAARPGTIFTALADGAVINAVWTVNFGYVIYLQHPQGLVSVYKHGASINKKEGDIVLKGDLLGTIGDKGVLSSGSHLHLEIWKDGVPQDPLMYLTK
ncbi:MAG: M23 family metallopeptidase, partial [Balneolaceae bacterium]